MNNFLKSLEEKTNIHLKSFIIGTVIFTSCCIIGYSNKQDILFSVSAVGILYLGYYCKNFYWGLLLGAIGTTPFIIIHLCDNLMGCNNTYEFILATVCLLVIGSVIGAFGAYIKGARRKAEIEVQKTGKNKKKNKKN